MNHIEIESKWQNSWEHEKAFHALAISEKPKFYALDMFPYPSGSGLHVGHIASYTPADIIARYKRAQGFNVLHPMGYDAFGLPAEQFAIQTGVHPAITTQKAIESFRKTLKSFGFSFDWSREISTCEPNYYKWTQFIFLKLWEKGLAYQKEVPVNWCPALKTVLANDEIIDGKSERGGHPVIRVPMKQWMLKITDYAERLLQDLDGLDWPERTKEAQKNWIGKSEGARIKFNVEGSENTFEVFTTRPDTLFGVTFMVMAPEHPLVREITTSAQKSSVEQYILETSKKSEIDRKTNAQKSGVFTGAHTKHPFTGKLIPIWISDYVLMDYGTGSIMAVPGHDTRDFEFATQFSLPILRVLEGGEQLPFEGDGILINSEFLNGLDKLTAISNMSKELEKRNLGQKEIQYKLRDWLFSRQRYWGEPFPLVKTADGKHVPLSLEELPLTLPEVANYEPSDEGEAPLARNQDWVKYHRAGTDIHGHRETDTMPGSAGSSWYFLRYIDPANSEIFCDFEKQKYWMPVDLYVGGPEHTVGHLLYARFWQKVLFDCGLVSHNEPFKKLAHQGMILGSDNEKMSKSRGNVVPADDIAKSHGADALRAFVCFMGPFDKEKPWSPTGIDGVKRFLDRLTRLIVDDDGNPQFKNEKPSPELLKVLHKTIKKVGHDIEVMSFNTCISSMMILVNEIYRLNEKPKEVLMPLAQLLQPFAPHLAEELWQKMGGIGFVSLAPWPKYDNDLCADNVVTMGVQVNGKMRGTIEINIESTQDEAVKLAKAVATVHAALDGKSIDKIIYKAGKILNLIVK